MGREEDSSITKGSMRYDGGNRGDWDLTSVRFGAAANTEPR